MTGKKLRIRKKHVPEKGRASLVGSFCAHSGATSAIVRKQKQRGGGMVVRRGPRRSDVVRENSTRFDKNGTIFQSRR